MKKLYFLLLTVLCAASANAQTPMLTPQVIASTGGFSSNANGSLSYTVGEMTMVQTFSANGNILTQGFQQPNDLTIGLIEVTHDDYGSFVVYPNPSVDNTYLGFEMPEAGKINIDMFDAIGQKVASVYSGNYESGKIVTQTNVSTFAAGMYLMTMTFTATKDGKTYMTTKKLQVIRD